MNKLYFVLLSFYCFSLNAQVWEDNLLKTNSKPSVFEKFTAFENYRSVNPYTKGNGYKPYAREMDFILKRVTENTVFDPTSLYTAWKKEKDKSLDSKIASSANWVAKGPINTPIILLTGGGKIFAKVGVANILSSSANWGILRTSARNSSDKMSRSRMVCNDRSFRVFRC